MRAKVFLFEIGSVVNRLTIVGYEPETDRNGKTRAICICSCGKETRPVASQIKSGKTKSCGCLQRDTVSICNFVHGESPKAGRKQTAENIAWSNMKKRCENKKDKYYEDYGGRGITVCERWRDSYASFLEDMGRKPSKLHSIDRIDNSKEYCPENCRWSTMKQQARNTRRNRIISVGGVEKCVSEWAEIYNIGESTIRRRIARGMEPETAVTTPVKK